MGNSSDNKRIAKNTGMLYFRLLFLTAINLYTVRITLNVLGVVDYGIYNAIASLVASLAVLNGAMTSATQRFLSFHLGKEDYYAYSRVYSLLILGFLILTGVIIFIGEAFGNIFVDRILNIPADRMTAARWIFQTALFSFGCQLMVIPFASSIVANEKMSAFAMFSVVDGVLKLGVVAFLLIWAGDRLILYGVLILVETILVLLMHIVYCIRQFKFCHFQWLWDKDLFKELTSYTGWNLFGSLSGMLTVQGQNVLLNMFFGPVINAAKAIGDRIYNVIMGFSTNLYMAVSPQIIKSYAVGEMERVMTLVYKSTRFSFMLLMILVFPLVCNIRGVLSIWLGKVSNSEDMAQFVNLMLVYCLVGCLEPPISRLIQATGHIKKYQIYVGMFTILYIPVAALVLWAGSSAIMTMVVLIVMMSIAMVIRLYVAHNQVGLSYREYMINVVIPIVAVTIPAIIGYLLIERFLPNADLWSTAVGITACLLYSIVMVWFLGLRKSDREFVTETIRKKLKH